MTAHTVIVVPPFIDQPSEFYSFPFLGRQRLPYGAACVTGYMRQRGLPVRLVDFNVQFPEIGAELTEYINTCSQEDIDMYLSGTVENERLDSVAMEMIENIPAPKESIYGFSIFSRHNLISALIIAKNIRELRKCRIVFAGAFITLLAASRKKTNANKFMEKYSCVDYLVLGDGGCPMEMLVSGESPGHVPGLAWRMGEQIFVNERGGRELDILTSPDYDDIIGFYGTQDNDYRDGAWMPYKIAEGCNNRCSFCNRGLVEPDIKIQDAGQVVENIRLLIRKYGPRKFYFVDNSINMNRKYLMELCEKIVAAGLDIEWAAAASVGGMDKKLLMKMKAAGCAGITWGVESGSDKILKAMRKGFDRASVSRVMKEAYSCGIANRVNIISGFIGETWEDVRATEGLLAKNIEYIDGIRIFDFILVPGTPIYLSPGEYGIENIVENDEFNLNPGETGFDEVGGLRWDEKKRQNKEFYKYIRRVSDNMLKKKEKTGFFSNIINAFLKKK